MKATISGLSAVLLTLALTAAAQAWFGCGNCPPAVNAFSPSCCSPYWDGGGYSPYGNWPPYGEPFQGFRPPGPTGFSVYPFARSPRDYFMVDP